MRQRIIISVAVLLLLVAFTALMIALQRPLQRRGLLPRTTAPEPAPIEPIHQRPVEEWTGMIIAIQASGNWQLLDSELDEIRQRRAGEYSRFGLEYLHARARLEIGEWAGAAELLEPLAAGGSEMRDLALHYLAQAAAAGNEPERAAAHRESLIFEFPDALYRSEAIEDQLAWLESSGEMQPLLRFVDRLRPSAETRLRRELDAAAAASLMRARRLDEAIARGMTILEGSVSDDAAEKAFRLLDRPEVLSRLQPDQIALLGESAASHRHYDRAAHLLRRALPHLPDRQDELMFAIGRAQFGNEQYGEAEKTYLRGAETTADAQARATFYFHASRTAQLLGDDARAERFMTSAIAVPGSFPATKAALNQRIRTRAAAGRLAEARSDVSLLKRLFPNDYALVEGTKAYALAALGAGRGDETIALLDSLPSRLLDRYDSPEIAYWKARALEKMQPDEAMDLYLEVLTSPVPTHFAYFTRQRLSSGSAAKRIRQGLEKRRAEVARLVQEESYDVARGVQTQVVLLSPGESIQRELALLRSIYLKVPTYAEILELRPEPLPGLGGGNELSRLDRLLALGLFDDAIDRVPERYPLQRAGSALTQSLLLHWGGAARESIHAIEVLMRSVPEDFVPELLPRHVQQLLYPRYFHRYILDDAKRFDADPRLVLSIMREESRFDPRARSAAAARGLLQFIITTARDVGRQIGLIELTAEDLYDPRIVIQLGAKYVGGLLGELDANPYQAAAAYNAGPNQVRLWKRLLPARGDDWFLSSINFDETKHYVRKVMNSYERYGQIYENEEVVGGLRIEP
ncbi:MAG TPA: transglycosylase SLT domain-containing protein [Thermoanaerobaculia bacterium]|nr:transglycosylase SLT domain-containing protein [Thermoanaerobaculia bacterium]